MADNTECPKCGKKTVVQRKGDLYECLNCDFKRDFAQFEPPQPKSYNGLFWTGVVSALVALFLLQARDTSSNTQYLKKAQSSPQPIAVEPNPN